MSPTSGADRPERIRERTYVGIDVRGALGLTGTMLAYLSLSALIPLAFAIGYREPIWPFVGAGAIAGGVGLGLQRLGRRSPGPIGFREGYLVVSLTWLLAAAYAALPYLLSDERQVSRPVDAFFEGMSGFSTTGATVIVDVEALDRSLLLWRQLSQWLGGMGIIVLALAVLPRLRIGGRQMFESELPGPEVHQLAERIRDTARRLWLLYIALTAVLIGILLLIGLTGLDDRMDPFSRGRQRAHDDAARRLLHRPALARAVRARDAVGRRAVHGDRGSQLRPPLPRARPSPARASSSATRRPASTARCSCSARRSSSSS